ncbi:hypothetical protein [Brevibacterium casei]|uniref:Uncharacterized protein n=1 Tax=Brevibacterium casei TaxID=33889 RepID=A0A7T2THK5_9MICO|nr:hypothetical protein [Brevibacterium casei]QPS33997.1 hypothetical protein I6G59_01240 [Brevibacterium casei]
MTMNDHEKRILEALDPSAETDHDRRVREALTGGEYLYGLPEPEADYDDTVRVWAAKESLRSAAERFARSTVKPMTDAEMEQVVSETWDRTQESWPSLQRMERTAEILDRLAARFEGAPKP